MKQIWKLSQRETDAKIITVKEQKEVTYRISATFRDHLEWPSTVGVVTGRSGSMLDCRVRDGWIESERRRLCLSHSHCDIGYTVGQQDVSRYWFLKNVPKRADKAAY